jgi:hypothetical protein
MLLRASAHLLGCLLVIWFYQAPFPAIAADTKTTAAPVLTVEKSRFEVGSLVEGDPVFHAISYTNNGDADLVLHDVKTDCACTTVTVDKNLPPGRSGKLELAIDTANQSGTIERKIALHSNDPLQPVMVLKIAMEIAPAISVQPDRIFLDGFTGEVESASVTLTANRELPLDVKLDSFHLDDGVNHSLSPIKAGRSYRLAVTHSARAAGTTRGRLILATNYPMHPRIVIPVFCRTRDLVETVPDSLDFGILQKARYYRQTETVLQQLPNRPLPTKSCILRLNNGTGLHLSGVEIPASQFKSHWETIVPGTLYRITLTPRLAELPTGMLTTTLKLTTNCDRYTSHVVPVSIKIE